MLDTETKRRIDTARDILVGKVPDPKSQVEQITIALIYKFMDDMDAEVEELGGDRSFFADSFAKFGWGRLMSPTVGGHELLSLYSEGISTMPQNAGIPALFRDIFKNAYLPYRDPETLKSFLKVIDGFTYDHSERLGDAFEYLLSVLGSQGDAGQFRTPRHIIDFMVEVLRPQKGEVILDPACGTAGFLISAYKHILRSNLDALGNSTLTPDEKGLMATNFKGYDISPDMVRLSLVNLYLHGFKSPQIVEYDTLTSEDRWNEFADVILANPPFMSPKGGIKPHKRFSIKAKRSEVLFVDYMAEHLSPRGRAGIIVPEGIIFQSQTAYKDLRKMLVENSLVAVISLPAGVFNPYSGVKTSILILDKSLAKKTDKIAFFKVENDGFGLGAQRRAVEGDDLPFVLEQITNYQLRITNDELESTNDDRVLIVPKSRIAANGDYNLSGERYRDVAANASLSYPLISIGEICTIERGGSPRPIHDFITDSPDGINWIKIGDTEVGSKYITKTKERIIPEGAKKSRAVKKGDFILSNSMSFGRPYIMAIDGCIHDGWLLLRNQSEQIDQDFLYLILGSDFVIQQFKRSATGGVVNNLNSEIVRGVQIPLPPIAIQKEIVAEIEGYQKVINGARAVIENYRPHIAIDPDWEIVELGELCVNFHNGANFSKEQMGQGTLFVNIKDLFSSGYIDCDKLERVELTAVEVERKKVNPNDLLFVRSSVKEEGVGFPSLMPDNDETVVFCGFIIKCSPNSELVLPTYLLHLLRTPEFRKKTVALSNRANITNISQDNLKSLLIPVPPIEIQKAIVAEIEAEQTLVNANRELIERFEKKIQTVLNRIWGGE